MTFEHIFNGDLISAIVLIFLSLVKFDPFGLHSVHDVVDSFSLAVR